MARSRRTPPMTHDVIHSLNAHIAAFHASGGIKGSHVRVGNLSFHGTAEQMHRSVKAGKAPKAAVAHLKAEAHHGRTAITHHGPGGLKPPKMKIAKAAGRPKVKTTIKHVSGAVKIPNSMHHQAPGLHHHGKVKI